MDLQWALVNNLSFVESLSLHYSSCTFFFEVCALF